MKILLISMPDTVQMIDSLIRFPNIGIASIAGNLGAKHIARILDLVSYGHNIKTVISEQLNDFRPDIVGLSAMTFQFDTLVRIARFIKKHNPGIKIVAGGYHATLMSEEIASSCEIPIDFIIRGEGEHSFRMLADGLESGIPDFDSIPGLSFRKDKGWTHNRIGDLLNLAELVLPARNLRISQNFKFLLGKNLRVDVLETSRGCPFNCKFCSITHMYGNTFRKFPVSRIMQDLRNIRALGFSGAFIADDNITYDIGHFTEICDSIIENGLNDIFYIVQVSAIGIAGNPDLVKRMKEANFKIAFVGFESMDSQNLKSVKKPSSPETNVRAAGFLRENDIAIVAGGIFGYPDDDYASVKRNFRMIRSLRNDLLYPQYLTPYPKTMIREELLSENLIVNKDDFSLYEGYNCNVRTRKMGRRMLFLSLQFQMLIDYFDSKHLRDNYFLKKHGWGFVMAIKYNFFITLLNILTCGARKRKYDV